MSKNYSSDILENGIREKSDIEFYKLMTENFGNEILVTDGDGRVIFANPASCESMTIELAKLVGKNVNELVTEGYIEKSAAAEVLKTRRQVNMFQKVKDGRVFLTTGVPIFDNKKESIIMVIVTSKDVEEVNNLLETLAQKDQELETNREIIKNLRESVFNENGFITADPIMEKIVDSIMKIAPMDLAVMIEGETGVGKEVLVNIIYNFSNRKNAPLVKINCGNIPENLIESELFGYKKGAFTGAEKEGKKGRIEVAEGGTLFLDEIGELPLQLQVKMLDFLQDGTYTKVGDVTPQKADVRVVAATNRDLKEMCEQGKFRQDLYYRLNVFPLKIPPLRERLLDIDALTKHFIMQYNSKYNMNKTFSKDFVQKLKEHTWPGNVRELQHVLERTYIMSDSDHLTREDLKDAFREPAGGTGNPGEHNIICRELMPLKDAKNEVERQLVTRAYKIFKSSYKVADALKIGQSTAARLIQKYR